jgi:hypothetical protein
LLRNSVRNTQSAVSVPVHHGFFQFKTYVVMKFATFWNNGKAILVVIWKVKPNLIPVTGSSHVDVIALGEVVASEIDIKREN